MRSTDKSIDHICAGLAGRPFLSFRCAVYLNVTLPPAQFCFYLLIPLRTWALFWSAAGSPEDILRLVYRETWMHVALEICSLSGFYWHFASDTIKSKHWSKVLFAISLLATVVNKEGEYYCRHELTFVNYLNFASVPDRCFDRGWSPARIFEAFQSGQRIFCALFTAKHEHTLPWRCIPLLSASFCLWHNNERAVG